MKNFIYLFIVLFLVLSCDNIKEKEKKTQIIYGNQPSRPLDQLILDVVNKGDSLAYYELSNAYLDCRYETFLPYALVMANKYDYPQAYFDVYDCLWSIYGKPSAEFIILDSLDITTQKMAIDYLKKASSIGHEQAKEILGDYYLHGMYVEKDTILGKQLIQEAESPRKK